MDVTDPLVSGRLAAAVAGAAGAATTGASAGSRGTRRRARLTPCMPLPCVRPQVHCSRFFYGPMLQGRDGIGACPCCGTGVVFRRDVLVSMGGQSYGSITEDYNTAMAALSAGHATMCAGGRAGGRAGGCGAARQRAPASPMPAAGDPLPCRVHSTTGSPPEPIPAPAHAAGF